jgi:thiol:disulfide interchange protein DsbD
VAGRPRTRVSLLANAGPGAQLTFGVRFQMEDGWHVYWRNAGGSGSPPAITWTSAAGLKTGDIQWPVPARIRVDNIVSYGYEREVLLLVPVTRTSSATGAMTVGATVDYVACKDICVKEAATVSMALPASNSPARTGRPADAALFEQARARLPRPAPAGWTATARLGADSLTLRIATRTPPKTGTFFPFVNGLIDDTASQRASADASGLTLQIAKSPYFSKAPAALEGVLVTDAAAFTIKALFQTK